VLPGAAQIGLRGHRSQGGSIANAVQPEVVLNSVDAASTNTARARMSAHVVILYGRGHTKEYLPIEK
jgi:hypothetical protein